VFLLTIYSVFICCSVKAFGNQY